MRAPSIEECLGYAAAIARELPSRKDPERARQRAVDAVVKALAPLDHESRARVVKAASIVVGLE